VPPGYAAVTAGTQRHRAEIAGDIESSAGGRGAVLIVICGEGKLSVHDSLLLIQRRHRHRVTPRASFAFMVVPKFMAGQFQRDDVVLSSNDCFTVLLALGVEPQEVVPG
jgi:hypothetical protein